MSFLDETLNQIARLLTPPFESLASVYYEDAGSNLRKFGKAVALSSVKLRLLSDAELYVGDLWTFAEAQAFKRTIDGLTTEQREQRANFQILVTTTAYENLRSLEERCELIGELKQLVSLIPEDRCTEPLRQYFQQTARLLLDDLTNASRTLKILDHSPNFEIANAWKSRTDAEKAARDKAPTNLATFLQLLVTAVEQYGNQAPAMEIRKKDAFEKGIRNLELARKKNAEMYNRWLNREIMARQESNDKLASQCDHRRQRFERMLDAIEKQLPVLKQALAKQICKDN